eukprot:3307534-Ditylum_brightwellii.AAC.1
MSRQPDTQPLHVCPPQSAGVITLSLQCQVMVIQLASHNFPTETKEVCMPSRRCAPLASSGILEFGRLAAPTEVMVPPPGSPTRTGATCFVT